MIAALLFLVADPTQLTSKIEDVTLYPSTALVHRSASIAGSGAYVLRGLPQSIDPNEVRVRCAGGAVISVEVKRRLQDSLPSERLAALNAKLAGLRRDLKVAEDERDVVTALGAHLAEMMKQEESAHRSEIASGRPSPDSWRASWDFVATKLAENKAALRDAQQKVEARLQLVREAEQEFGRLNTGKGVPVHDVIVDVQAGSATRLDFDYLVGGTGWQPAYELRTSSDLAKVGLTYRARIHQSSGEDWTDVALALSTAQPQRGAQGPEPQPVWLSLYEPQEDGLTSFAKRAPASAAPMEVDRKRLGALAYSGDDKEDKSLKDVFATVESQGVSVRFQLPRRETVLSRDDVTTVLVGEAALEVAMERICVPAVDTTVWLQGRAKNSSAWTLLPGPASVFLGQDFLGHAHVELVPPGAELTLHLGADAAITVERTVVQDLSKGPGFLSSRATKIQGWRVHLENHNAVSRAADGSVDVIVREVLPRSTDDRIQVELSSAQPKPSDDERWKKDRDEKGIHTWIVRVPKNGATDLNWEYTTTFPKDAQVVQR